jgi:hypothetical protein
MAFRCKAANLSRQTRHEYQAGLVNSKVTELGAILRTGGVRTGGVNLPAFPTTPAVTSMAIGASRSQAV